MYALCNARQGHGAASQSRILGSKSRAHDVLIHNKMGELQVLQHTSGRHDGIGLAISQFQPMIASQLRYSVPVYLATRATISSPCRHGTVIRGHLSSM